MKTATLCFLLKKNADGVVDKVCLAMKKKGFGQGKWNGSGGKVEAGETIDQAMVREVKEEIGVDLISWENRGILFFADNGEDEFTLEGHVYVSFEWEGEPLETDEMAPKWFSVSDIPYSQMWVDDTYWLPLVINGKTIEAEFWLTEGGEEIVKYNIEVK